MITPPDLFYSKEHEWTTAVEGTALIGVTSYAVEQLGDIVHVELPSVGEEFDAGDPFGTIESTKTVSDLYMPISGKILKINEAIIEAPETLQTDAFDKGWLIKVKVIGDDSDDLMSASAYNEFIEEE